jgi:c-di-GMP-binding flagellar brake protein YcgR
MGSYDPTKDADVEHRRAPRVSLFQDVFCQAKDGTTAHSQAADLSVGGMFVDLSSPPFLPEERLNVRFGLRAGEAEVAAEAEVNYVQDGIGVGIRFVSMRAVDVDRVAAFVEETLQRKAPQGEHHLRKSARVSITVPIKLRAAQPDGAPFDEATSIITLSKHGACLLTSHPVPLGGKLYLETPSGREFKGSVVWVGDYRSRSEGQVGIQCRGLAQSLGFRFP